MQERILIDENETAGELHDKMKDAGARLLLETIKGLADGILHETSQSKMINQQPEILKHAPKIFTETTKIDWSKTVDDIHNLIRGLSPYPGAFTGFNGKTLKIYRSKKEAGIPNIEQGQFDTDQKTFLKFACADGFMHPMELQLEGKKRMGVEDFLRGYKF